MSKRLDEIIETTEAIRKAFGKCGEQYINITLFEELLGKGAQLVQANADHLRGNYLHSAVYKGIVYISTSDEILRTSFLHFN